MGLTGARVELELAGVWTDVTAFVSELDPITITRGKSANASAVDPSSLSLRLNNRDGRFSPRNPMSPYFGVLGRNTPIRVSVPDGTGGRSWRFHGEVSKWPQRWDISGKDRYVTVKGYGVRRRLTLNAPPLRSTMFREHADPARTGIRAYWPFEDASGSSQAAAGVLGVEPASVTGPVQMGEYRNWTSSDPLPLVNGGAITATVPPFEPTGQVAVRAFVFVAEAVTSETSLIALDMARTGVSWDLRVLPNGSMRILATNSEGGQEVNFVWPFAVNSRGFMFVTIELEKNGNDVDWRVIVTDFTNTQTIRDSIPQEWMFGTLSSRLVGVPARVVVGRGGGLGSVVVGHLAVADAIDAFADTLAAIAAHNGENPSNRITRLCGEEGLTASVLVAPGAHDNVVTLGDQLNATLVELLDEAADTDMGLLTGSRNFLGFEYRPRASLFGQSPAVVLDYASGQIAGELEPTDDDDAVQNAITVRRAGGSTVTVEQTSGPLSVLPPPDGVSRYAHEVDVSLETDAMLAEQAAFRLRRGTVDEARYPQLTAALHSPQAAELRGSLLAVDVGDRLDITGLAGTGLPPEDTAQLVEGYTESLRVATHEVTFNLSPYSPWLAGTVDEARADTDGSRLSGPPPSAPGFAGAAPLYVNGTDVSVPIPAGAETVVACVAWNTLEPLTVPAGWAVLRSLTHNTSQAVLVSAPADVADTLFRVANASKVSVTSLGYSAATVHVSAALLDSDGDAVHAAPAVTVGDVPARLVRFFWDKATTTTSFTANDTNAVARVVQYGTGAGSCAVLGTDQIVSAPGTVPLATATSDVTAGQAGGFTVALVSAVPPEPVTGLSETATEMSVESDGIPWGTSPGDMPYDVIVGGERMTVTNVAGASSPQTFTVVRSVNGIVKSHAVGTTVALFDPAFPAY